MRSRRGRAGVYGLAAPLAFLIVSCLSLLISIPGAVDAASQAFQPIELDTVSPTSILLDSYQYAPGQVITGKVVFKNTTGHEIDNVSYDMELGMPVDFDATKPVTGSSTVTLVNSIKPGIFDSAISTSTFNVLPGTTKEISISFPIVGTVSGKNIPLIIDVYNGGGYKIGENDTLITVSGKAIGAAVGTGQLVQIKSVNVSGEYIATVSGQVGSAQTGSAASASSSAKASGSNATSSATVDSDGPALIRVRIAGIGKTTLPKGMIAEADYWLVGDKDYSWTATTSVSAAEVSSGITDLPVPSSMLRSGQYEGVVYIKAPVEASSTSTGYAPISYGEPVNFTIQGIGALIQTISVSKDFGSSKNVPIRVLWSPTSSVFDASGTPAQFILSLQVTNPEGDTLYSGTSSLRSAVADESIRLSAATSTIVISATISSEGRILADYSETLTSTARPLSWIDIISEFGWLVFAVFVLIIVLVLFKRMGPGKMMILAIVILTIPPTAYGWTLISQTDEDVTPQWAQCPYGVYGGCSSTYNYAQSQYNTSNSLYNYTRAGQKNPYDTVTPTDPAYLDCPTNDLNVTSVNIDPLSTDNQLYPGEWYVPSATYTQQGNLNSNSSGPTAYPQVDVQAYSGNTGNNFSMIPGPQLATLAQALKNIATTTLGSFTLPTVTDTSPYAAFQSQLIKANYRDLRSTTFYPDLVSYGYYGGGGEGFTAFSEASEGAVGSENYTFVNMFTAGTDDGTYNYNTGQWNSSMSELGLSALSMVTPSPFNAVYDGKVGSYQMFAEMRNVSASFPYSNYHFACKYINIQSYAQNYTIVNNSHVLVVVFNDKNSNGVMDPGEEALSPYMPAGYSFGWSWGDTNVPAPSCWTDMGDPTAVDPSDPRTNNTEINPSYTGGSYASILSAFADTTYPVARGPFDEASMTNGQGINGNTNYDPDDYGNGWYVLSKVNQAKNPTDTPNNTNSWEGVYYANQDSYNSTESFDSTNRLDITDGGAGQYCGTTNWGDPTYNGTIVPPVGIKNGGFAYSIIPVNEAITPYWTIGLSSSTVPTGWRRTTPDQNITLDQSGGVVPVYLGITNTVPPTTGVCGPAASTTSTYEYIGDPSLCDPNFGTASSTSLVDNGDNWSWTCDGLTYGTSTACTEDKCGDGTTYCAVLDECLTPDQTCQATTGVCGDAQNDVSLSAPTDNLCSVAPYGNSGPWDYYGTAGTWSWSCYGNPPYAGYDGTCTSNKCGSGEQYCSQYDDCEPLGQTCDGNQGTIGTTGTGGSNGNLLSNVRMSPSGVSSLSKTCNLDWNLNTDGTQGISCSVDGQTVSDDDSVTRTDPVHPGIHTLTCTTDDNVTTDSTSTKCQLLPQYTEI